MVINQEITDSFAWYHGDSCEVLPELDPCSVGFSIFSPPFSDLYCYSDCDRDLGNCKTPDEFFAHFRFIGEELIRLLMPGRNVAIHCMDLPSVKSRDGYIGLRDFPGEIIRLFQNCGFIYHSRVCIWKDPLIAATRTKALGLMHKQLIKDSHICRHGIADSLIVMRKPGDNPNPISHDAGLKNYIGGDDPGGRGEKRSHYIWQRYASPVWMDIRATRTLNAVEARDERDEKHISPLQLDVIERCLELWTNPGDVVLSPFGGIGSEGYASVQRGRRFIGVELKESYWSIGLNNLYSASKSTQDLFG